MVRWLLGRLSSADSILFGADIFTSHKAFSAAGYAAFRPSYPPQLYNTILKYRGAPSPSGTLLDLGCGHGVVGRALSPHFDHVIGTDPSASMVKQARETTQDAKITFRQGFSHELDPIPGESVDMVTAAQSSHWFDYAKTWPRLARVVRSGGTLAFWGYKDNIFLGYPQVNAIIEEFCYGGDPVAPGVESMNAYWEPGRFKLRNSLREVEPPAADWEDVRRLIYDPDRLTSTVGEDEQEAAWQRRTLKLGEFEGYIRTFSSFIGWQNAHPEMKSRAEGGEGDLGDIMFDRILDVVPEWKARGEGWRDIEVDSIWGTTVILAKRR